MRFEIKVIKRIIKETKLSLTAIAKMMGELDTIKDRRLHIRISDFLVEEFIENDEKVKSLELYLKGFANEGVEE